MNTNNYLPFDLETALKHPERVVTRDGRKVQELYHFKTKIKSDYEVYVVLDGDILTYTIDGFAIKYDVRDRDLFLLPEVKECWVNVNEDENSIWFSGCFNTELDARQAGKAMGTYLKTIRITNEPE